MTESNQSRREEGWAIAAALLVLYTSLLDPRLSLLLALAALLLGAVYALRPSGKPHHHQTVHREDDYDFDQWYK